MSNQRRARERLLELCEPDYLVFSVEDIQASIRAIVAEELFRRVHRTSLGEKTKYLTPTPEVVLAIRRDKIANNALPSGQRVLDIEIGKRYGVQIGGRVSEILYGDCDGKPMYDVKGVRLKAIRRRRVKIVDVEDLM